MKGACFIVLGLLMIGCSDVENEGLGLSLSTGISKYPLGADITEIEGFADSGVVYESNWTRDTAKGPFVSEFAALWHYRWGDYSYFSKKEGYTVFIKKEKIFAHLINARGKNNELDLKNGIHIGMRADSAAKILNIKDFKPSHWHQFITDSLTVLTLNDRVTSYCIFSNEIEKLFCSTEFDGKVGIVRRAIESALNAGVDIDSHNYICADEERDKYRVQFEYLSAKENFDDHRSRRFLWDYSAVFWFEKSTGNLLNYNRPRLDN